jgi:hypothetical protein
LAAEFVSRFEDAHAPLRSDVQTRPCSVRLC